MFKQLECLLKNCASINMILAANKDGTLSVTVLPKPKQSGDETLSLSTPLSLTATAEELDAEFATLLGNYVGSHQSLAEQLENTNAILEAAKKESQKKATSTISKASTKESPDKAGEVISGDDEGGEGDDSNTGSLDNSSSGAQATEPVNLWG
jgi:PRTRC genetic system protein E